MSDQSAKQQVIETIKSVNNILVTVSTNPSVDELSAALGMTLLLNKAEKHATAVFSGDIPPAITFLDPEKTFESTVDSLRDFIIALDKEKADHLRYKVEGDLVKIYITPYRTTITDKDLEFSQGDYNVEMVIAIGVQSDKELDKALADHGRIMHDATVASLSIGDENSKLGTVSWHDGNASSYSEMLVSVAEGIRSDKSLLDEQIATAFLTGIVAATERFSNNRTSADSMTIAAQLMAAGANQQLIATKLEEADEIPSANEKDDADDDSMTEDKSHKIVKDTNDEPVKDKVAPDGTMTISHEFEGDVEEVATKVAADNQSKATYAAKAQLESLDDETALAQSLAANNVSASPSVNDIKNDLEAASAELEQVQKANVPSLGGTLNATTEQAEIEARNALESDKNNTILSHGTTEYVGHPPTSLPPVNSFNASTDPSSEPASVDVFAGDQMTQHSDAVSSISGLPSLSQSTLPPTQSFGPMAPALSASEHAASFANPLSTLPPMPDFASLPPLPAMPGVAPATPQLGTMSPGIPGLSQLPSTPPPLESVLPPLPQMPIGSGQKPATPSDPSQFHIPGQ